jgi:hypothetical protein
MCDDQWRTVTRRAALALLLWLGVATAGPGCSPAGQASSRAAGIPDRLKTMRNRSQTGDPRPQARRSPQSSRQKPTP